MKEIIKNFFENEIVSIKKIEASKKQLGELEQRLQEECHLVAKAFKKNNISEDEKGWMITVVQSLQYAIITIQSFINSADNYKSLQDYKYTLYVGKIALLPLSELINGFEQRLNLFIDSNNKIAFDLDSRIQQKIDIIRNSWNPEAQGKSKKLRENLITNQSRNRHGMDFIRTTLKKQGVIDQSDVDVWQFAWDIRNSMHMNFCSVKNIDFQYLDLKTGEKYVFKFAKGEQMYHQGGFIGLFSITEQLVSVLLKIFRHYKTQ